MYDLLCHNSFLLVKFGCSRRASLSGFRFAHRTRGRSLRSFTHAKAALVQDDKLLNYLRAPAVSFLAAPLRMPRTSSSRMMMNSSPSSLISVPEYLPNRMRSPSFTSRGRILPSSLILPLPTEITSPSCGFSFAVSGTMIPPRVESEEHTSELQSQFHLVCRLLLEKKNKKQITAHCAAPPERARPLPTQHNRHTHN